MKCQLLFVFVLVAPLRSSEDIYAEVNGKVTLRPTPTGSQNVNTVVWKLGNDKVAEFDPAFDNTATYYGNFNERAVLDLQNGIITISDLTENDTGEFSVEINNVQQSAKISLKVIPPVSNPTVTRNDATKDKCVLVCKAENSLEYHWTGEGELGMEKYMLTVSQDHPSEFYTCNATNQAGWRNATVRREDKCGESFGTGAKTAVGLTAIFAIAVATASVFLCKKKKGTCENNPEGNNQGNREKPSYNEAEEMIPAK